MSSFDKNICAAVEAERTAVADDDHDDDPFDAGGIE